jgi:hypothetical protein
MRTINVIRSALVYTFIESSRRYATSVIPDSSASETASDDGADTAASEHRKRNVTTPEGGPTAKGCHTEPTSMWPIAT